MDNQDSEAARSLLRKKVLRKVLDKRGQTTINNKHFHNYTTDSKGNGKTTATFPVGQTAHTHTITNNVVAVVNDHSHRLR